MAIPANAREAAESIGLKAQRGMTHGTWVRRIPCDEAEIEVACPRDFGVVARIVGDEPDGSRPEGTASRAA